MLQYNEVREMLSRHYGKRIYDLEGLNHAFRCRKSVISAQKRMFSKRPQPASWVINMSGYIIKQLIDGGLYVYVTKAELKRIDKSNT